MVTETAKVTIVNLVQENEKRIREAAEMLVQGFAAGWPQAYPDLDGALQEVREFFKPDRICRVAVDETGAAIGWTGGIRHYNGHVWELHPLVVREGFRNKGIGSALVRDLAAQVKQRGGLTLWVGTDDETNMTNLGGVELFPGVLDHLRDLRNLRRHPFEFYLKVGFEIIGVMPDANGPGKPDIYMAMPVR
jgi:aminoglycoside 6'-N-acetyltransferase I